CFAVIWGDEYLKKQLVDFLGCCLVDRSVADNDPAEGRHGITSQCVLPGSIKVVACGYPTGIGMLQHGKGWRIELIDEGYSGIYVHQVVVRELFTVQFFKHGFQVAVKYATLMWVFAISEHVSLLFTLFEYRQRRFLVEIIENRRIIVGRYVECVFSERLAVLQEGVSLVFRKNGFQQLIVVSRRDDYHVVVVFCGCPDQRYATDVNFFDDFLFRCARGERFFKRIEVDNNQVDFWYSVFFQLLLVGIKRPPRQDAAENLGVECFDAATQYGRISGQVFHRNHVESKISDKCFRPSGRVKRDTEFV